jgi:hypothetical protein
MPNQVGHDLVKTGVLPSPYQTFKANQRLAVFPAQAGICFHINERLINGNSFNIQSSATQST